MSYKTYSRLARVEQQQNVKRIVLFAGLTIGLILLLVFFGISIVTNLTGFLHNTKDESINSSDDITPPPPPTFNTLPEVTNKPELTVEGNTEPGVTVLLHLNEETRELISDSQGAFNTSFDLQKGYNTLFATSRDLQGNESLFSKRVSVIFDDEKPALEIIKPKDGDKFSGKNQKQITIEGKTEKDANVTINGHVVVVSSDGKFSFPATLGEGDTPFNIKSTDLGGNLTEITISVHFTP